MPRTKTLDEAYDECVVNGQFLDIRQPNKAKARDMMENAQIAIDTAELLIGQLKKEDKR